MKKIEVKFAKAHRLYTKYAKNHQLRLEKRELKTKMKFHGEKNIEKKSKSY